MIFFDELQTKIYFNFSIKHNKFNDETQFTSIYCSAKIWLVNVKIQRVQENLSLILTDKHISSIVNEGIRAFLNLFIYLFFFFTRRFHTHKKHKAHTSKQKQKKQHFYAHKEHLRGRKSLAWRFVLFVLFMLFMFIKTSKRKKIACLMFCAFYAHKKHLRGRKLLVWRLCFLCFLCAWKTSKRRKVACFAFCTLYAFYAFYAFCSL